MAWAHRQMVAVSSAVLAEDPVANHLLMASVSRLEYLQNGRVIWPISKDNTLTGTWESWWSMYGDTEFKYLECAAVGMRYYHLQATRTSSGIQANSGACLSRVPSRAREQAWWYLSRPDRVSITGTVLNLSMSELAHWQEVPLDWVVLGFHKCGTSSLIYNLGLHPELRVKSSHAVVLDNNFMFSSRSFLPHRVQLRNLASRQPSLLFGHPDWRNPAVKFSNFTGKQTLVGAKLTRSRWNGQEFLSDAPIDTKYSPGRGLDLFLHMVLLNTKPTLKVLFVIRDPVDCAHSHFFWTGPSESARLQALLAKCLALAGGLDLELCASVRKRLGPCEQSYYLGKLCSYVNCEQRRLGLLLTGQVSERDALAATAKFFGATGDFAQATFRVHNRNKLTKEPLPFEVEGNLTRFFAKEYAALSRWLEVFSIVPRTHIRWMQAALMRGGLHRQQRSA